MIYVSHVQHLNVDEMLATSSPAPIALITVAIVAAQVTTSSHVQIPSIDIIVEPFLS